MASLLLSLSAEVANRMSQLPRNAQSSVLSLSLDVAKSLRGYVVRAPWLASPIERETFEEAYDEALRARHALGRERGALVA